MWIGGANSKSPTTGTPSRNDAVSNVLSFSYRDQQGRNVPVWTKTGTHIRTKTLSPRVYKLLYEIYIRMSMRIDMLLYAHGGGLGRYSGYTILSRMGMENAHRV